MKTGHIITALYEKYREQFWYLLVGGMTTAVDFAVYYLLSALTPLHYMVCYWIAWAVSVLFAFFPNRSLVFRNSGKKGFLRQVFEFVSSRVLTLIIGEGLLFLLVSVCRLPDMWMKPVVQILIVVLNYVFSKWIVFRKN